MLRAKRLAAALLVCLAGVGIALCLHLTFNRVQLRQINRAPYGDVEPPAPPERTLSYASTGSYPGLSDEPVSWEEGQKGRDLRKLLERHTYAPVALLRPRAGGVAVSTAHGCTPEYVAYWDGRFLWLPVFRREEIVWQGYLPSSPRIFGEELFTLCN